MTLKTKMIIGGITMTKSYMSAKTSPEAKENLTPIIEPKTKVENSEVAGQPLEQPKYETCRYCGAGRVVRPSGEWQYNCHCDEKIPIEQPVGCPDLDAMHLGIPNTPEQLNQNTMLLYQTDRVIGVAIGLLGQLKPKTNQVDGCITTLKSWQDNNFKHLKRAFE